MIDSRRLLDDEPTRATRAHPARTTWVDAIADVVARVLGAVVIVFALGFAAWGSVASLF
jgi:hypothetical protein